jgi:uncharacterized membrane protein YgcG
MYVVMKHFTGRPRRILGAVALASFTSLGIAGAALAVGGDAAPAQVPPERCVTTTTTVPETTTTVAETSTTVGETTTTLGETTTTLGETTTTGGETTTTLGTTTTVGGAPAGVAAAPAAANDECVPRCRWFEENAANAPTTLEAIPASETAVLCARWDRWRWGGWWWLHRHDDNPGHPHNTNAAPTTVVGAEPADSPADDGPGQGRPDDVGPPEGRGNGGGPGNADGPGNGRGDGGGRGDNGPGNGNGNGGGPGGGGGQG